jgi:hypothetical protein
MVDELGTSGRGRLSLLFFSLLTLMLTGCSGGDTTITTWIISAMAGISPIIIRASSKFAGAICGLTWNGKEFIDSGDHGRLLQSAVTFDGLGERYNPTEGGSQDDWSLDVSDSVLKAIRAKDNLLETETQMAYWLKPGEPDQEGKPAVNTTGLSDTVLFKKVEIKGHTIDYAVKFRVPQDYASARFEVLTAYMPVEFDKVWRLDNGELVSGEGNNTLPLVLSCGDHAMGIYAKGAIYDSFSPSDMLNPVVKWNVLYEKRPVPTGDYDFQCYVVVGSLENVRDGLKVLNG